MKIGITGGIGSGKTTVCKIFETLGIPVYYADERAKSLMESDLNIVEQVKNLFGQSAYLKNGHLNRSLIASIVFQDNSKLKALNAFVHPAVFQDAERWHLSQKGVPYTLKEAALLFESGSSENLDKIITVFAPKELRIHRVVERDGSLREAVEGRMKKQMSEEEKMRLADFVIFNDGKHPLINQVLKIHRNILAIKKK